MAKISVKCEGYMKINYDKNMTKIKIFQSLKKWKKNERIFMSIVKL